MDYNFKRGLQMIIHDPRVEVASAVDGATLPPGARFDALHIMDLAVTGRRRPLLHVLPLHRDLVVLPEAPRSGAEAPQHLLTPGLGQAMHDRLLPQQAAAPRAADRMPPGLWTLDACR